MCVCVCGSTLGRRRSINKSVRWGVTVAWAKPEPSQRRPSPPWVAPPPPPSWLLTSGQTVVVVELTESRGFSRLTPTEILPTPHPSLIHCAAASPSRRKTTENRRTTTGADFYRLRSQVSRDNLKVFAGDTVRRPARRFRAAAPPGAYPI